MLTIVATLRLLEREVCGFSPPSTSATLADVITVHDHGNLFSLRYYVFIRDRMRTRGRALGPVALRDPTLPLKAPGQLKV